jgi:histidinol-phosphatase (PHP family)
MDPAVVERGRRRGITFASDAHTTDALASNFYEAMAMAEHFGFRQGRQPEDFWTR